MRGVGVIVLALAVGAFGDVVELPLDCAGFYDVSTPAWTMDFDLGVTFSEISHVYIDWSGEITAGLAEYYSDPGNPFPLKVGVSAFLGSNPWRQKILWGGEGTYPLPEPFDIISEILPSVWSDLFDGQGTILIGYEEINIWPPTDPGYYIEHGSVMLNDATLIVEGTTVPEPTTLILFGFGFMSIRRWHKDLRRKSHK